MRIVSLLPAATEIVAHLGLADQLVGVSHACQPALDGRDVPVLTRSRVPADVDAGMIDASVRELLARGEPLFDLDESLLRDLKPDVILSQSLCNVCAIDGNQIANVARSLGENTKIFEWSPRTLEDVIDGIEQIGVAIDAAEAGRVAVVKMRRELIAIRRASSVRLNRPRVAFLEWVDPLFCAGHWIPEMIELAGGTEVLGVAGAQSRTISPGDLLAADPEIIVVCCCGWPAARTMNALKILETQDWWQSLAAVCAGRVHVVDAESAFTIPGPGLVNACRLLADLFQGAVVAEHALSTQ